MTIYEIRKATRRELIAFLESIGTACFSDESTSELRACAFEYVREQLAETKEKP